LRQSPPYVGLLSRGEVRRSMKKQQVDHILRSAGRITGERQFVIVGSQALLGADLELTRRRDRAIDDRSYRVTAHAQAAR
jgi:hypothetical protein